MRCRPMVVLPLPAPPWTTITPARRAVMISNCRGSKSAAISGRWRSSRRPRAQRGRAGSRSHGGPLAAGQPVRHLVGPVPGAGRVLGPYPLRAGDTLEHAPLDGQRAAGADLAGGVAIAEPLVVVAPLLVA